MPVKQTLDDSLNPVKIYTNEVEATALQQLKNLAQLPFIHSHVAAMPDVHAGIGATVGSVIPTKGAIIPAAVGVDIGCGMRAARLNLTANDLPDNLSTIRADIEAMVPVGFAWHPVPAVDNSKIRGLSQGLWDIREKHPTIATMQKDSEAWAKQLGTLGGGNHFIELCLDETDQVWLMLHSGSRGIGNCIGRYFIELAKQDMAQQLGNLPDKDLAYFTEDATHFDDYWQAVSWAQNYAHFNRKTMLNSIFLALNPHFGGEMLRVTANVIDCHHNYVSHEVHFGSEVYVTRKGAIRARDGDLGIIPGSMGARSYIVRGKGNADAFSSCAHGAGRRMSRTQAKKRFTEADLIAQTAGVECRKDASVIDEIPGAYKDIDQVMANQTDLVDVMHTLKQVLCVKG